jgi:hypoxanthine phosphoribosyltransferase
MEILIPEFKIERRVRAMAHAISEEHKASGNSLPLVMICVLKGGYAFFADLMKDMGIDVEIDFIRAKSYEGPDNSAGVKFTKDLEIMCKGKRVYIVDDIVDTGKTMMEILLRVDDMTPAEVKIVTLLKRKENSPPVDHFCFEINDEWVVGYGLDDNGLKRNYRNIYKIN